VAAARGVVAGVERAPGRVARGLAAVGLVVVELAGLVELVAGLGHRGAQLGRVRRHRGRGSYGGR